MDYGKLSRDLVADAIQNKVPGLNTEVVFHYLLGQGAYNAETGQYTNLTEDTDPISVIAARPSMEEVQNYGVVATSKKLVVPGKLLPHVPDTNVTVTMGGKLWTVCKVKEVPGGSVVLVFVDKT